MLWPFYKPFFDAASDAGGGAGGSGGAAGSNNGNGSGSNAGQGGAGGDEKKFTQADVDRILNERLPRAEEAANKKLFEQYGVKDAAELKAKIDKAAELEQAQMTELQKAQKAAKDAQDLLEAEKKKATDAEAKAQETAMRSEVLLAAATFNDPADAWQYVDRSKITVEADGKFKGVKEAVEAVAKAKPYLLKPQGTGHGTPRQSTRKGGDGKEPKPMSVSL